ncbi:MAG: 1-(5-phosphoribosyl)-5-amino-4-imidazole-carboxylate carboxylase [Ilumatobacter coccineus]|uniref:1-(5-phosphoribosyl)-5-amino-4-imidazole-carboxylate carboxylase n=1 Tax=Ilumatobacter coccineus TaxID=467094 RepID=A0A2G6KB37_9ACTN|nr:MAG: 1-(5-phosphoribosyl)-5-amino-4-imidazole-carboxylate carboxylase [Ilumatobacter coccineus]
MSDRRVAHLLDQVARHEISPDEAAQRLSYASFVDIADHARIDHGRIDRVGEPEVIFAAGKTPSQVADIVAELRRAKTSPIIATRATPAHAAAVADMAYDVEAGLLIDRAIDEDPSSPSIAVVCAGTSDLPVAREAAGVARAFGIPVTEYVDVGVAGVHRVIAERDRLADAGVCIVVAGMEGALPSVVAGMVPAPVIAVPTSVGYGASFDGVAALLAMMTSCAPGIGVVNIDNGFGAAMVARRILMAGSR